MMGSAAASAAHERDGAIDRRVITRLASAVLALGLLLVLAPAIVSADPGDIGLAGPSYQGASGSPSGSKPESKLWHHDGYWWASMWDVATSRFAIWRQDPTTQGWSRTPADIDTRTSSRSDILWDGTKLYIASNQWSESDLAGDSRLLRYSYDTSTDSYSLDSGYPATINAFRTETLTIAKDSTGQLWATWERAGQIWVNRSTTADNVWGTPFVIPGAANVSSDDISTIIAFGGDRIGVLWSNQATDVDSFAVHLDSAADTTWQPIETAYAGTDVADDHLNLKADGAGRVYAAVKTSLDGSSEPLIVLLVRQSNGTWSNHPVTLGSDQTRPIVLIDGANGLLRVFYTIDTSGGTINMKTSPISSISFPGGAGTVVAQDFDNDELNDVTSTKQTITSDTGLEIMATNEATEMYWFANILGGGPPPVDTTPPVRTAMSIDGPTLTLTYDEPLDATSTPAPGAFTASVNGGARSVSSVVVSGAAVTLTLAAPAVVSTDTVTLAYVVPATGPIQDVAGNDALAYAAQPVTNNTPPPGSGGTFTFGPTDDGQVKSNSATANYGSVTSLQLREDPGTGTTYRSYVKFNVTGLSGSVSAVKLRLWVSDNSTNTTSVHSTATTWTEGALNWNNAPALGATTLGSTVPATTGAWVEITLAPTSVTGNGIVAFGLKNSGTNSAIFNSSEAATNRPELVVTTSGGPPPGDTTAPVAGARTVNGATLVLTYNEALDPASEPANNAFTVAATSGARTVSDIVISGSTVTLTLNSPVLSSDTVTVAYALSGAPIQDVAGNDALAYAAQPVTNNTPPPGDTTAPVAGARTVNGATLVLTYNEALDPASEPANNAFTVAATSGARTVSDIVISGSTVTLTLNSPVLSSDTVTVAYALSGAPIQDVAGNDALAYAAQPVTNNTPPPGDTTAPVAGARTVNGATLVLTYNEALDPASEPANNAFTVAATSGARTVSDIVISGSTVTLTLNSPVLSSDTVTVAYALSGAPIQDVAGNDALAYAAQPVTNNTPPPGSGGTFTFGPTDDGQVKSNSATANYGSVTSLQLREDPGTGTTYRSYVKFNVTGLSGSVSAVKLRLWVSDNSTNTTSVHSTATTWTEGALNWNNAPALGATTLGSTVPATTGAWVEITLAPTSVTGNGIVAFGLKNSGTNSAIFNSSEAATNRPELVVTTSGGPPPGDTTAPVAGARTVNGATLVLTYNEALDPASEPANNAFTVAATSGARTVSDIVISGSTVTLTLNSPVLSSDTVTVAYALSGAPIQDVAGNDALAYAAQPVTNNTPPPGDTTAPVAGARTVNGATLVLTYNEALDPASEPANNAFTVAATSGARTVSDIVISGSTVTLTLNSPVLSSDTVTVAYALSGAPIQDVAGNDALAYAAQPVTNNTPPPGSGGTFTFGPTDDGQVKSNSATANYGSVTSLQLREDPGTGTTYRSYVKFNVTGLSGSVSAVKLRLWVSDNSTNTTSVHSTATTWTEGALNWNNAPALGATTLGSVVPATTGAWVEITLAPTSVTGNGIVAFGLKNSGTNSAIFNSSEAATNRPELVVTTSP